jgi:hypothetical protein
VLAPLSLQLEAEDASTAAHRTIDALPGATKSIFLLPSLAAVLEGLAPKLESETALVAAQRLLDTFAAMPATTDWRSFGKAVAALAARLSPEQATVLLPQLLSTMSKTTSTSALPGQSKSVEALAARLNSDGATSGIRTILDAQGKATNADTILALGKAVAVLAPRMSPEAGTAAAQNALDAMTGTTDLNARLLLSRALAGLAQRLAPEEASRMLLLALSRNSGVTARSALAVALAALAPRLEPGEARKAATQAARPLVSGWTGLNRGDLILTASEAFAALAPLMAPEEAARAAATGLQSILTLLPKTTNAGAVNSLIKATACLKPWLSSAEMTRAEAAVARAAAAAGRSALETMAKAANQAVLTVHQRNLVELAAWLAPEDAGALFLGALEQFAGTADKVSDPMMLGTCRTICGALTPRLGPKEAEEAGRKTLEVLTRTSDSLGLALFSRIATALAARMSPEEAGKMRVATARRLLDALAGTLRLDPNHTVYSAVVTLGQQMSPEEIAVAIQGIIDLATRADGLKAGPVFAEAAIASLAGRLNPPDAILPAQKLLKVVTDPKRFVSLGAEGKLLEALAARVEAEDAAALARQAIADLPGATRPDTRVALAGVIKATASRLERPEAAAVSEQVLATMGKTEDRKSLAALGQAVAALAQRLPPAEASPVVRAASDRLLKALDKPDLLDTVELVEAIAVLVSQLPSDTISAVARKVIAVTHTEDGKALARFGEAVVTLTQHLGPEERGKVRQVAFARLLEVFARTEGKDDATQPLTKALEHLAEQAGTQNLVDLLKRPTCVGGARKIVMQALGNRLDRKFADHWEAVEWLATNEPDVDLKEPPERPVR